MNYFCFAFEKNLVHQLPLKNKKNPVKIRYLNYLVINLFKNNINYIYIRKRTKQDIWANLYDFPCIETNKQFEPTELPLSIEWASFFGKKKLIIKKISGIYKHQLSHQTLYAVFYEIDIKSHLKDNPQNSKPIVKSEIKKYAVPRLIDKYLQSVAFTI